jgi:phospholipase/carboxylesterase
MMDANQLLPAVILGPGEGRARASVIWLHGLGADGYDFEPVVPELHLPAEPATRFIFPHAPQRRITVNNGYLMRAWYDVITPDLDEQEDAEGIRTSERQVQDLIEREIGQGIPAERIVLAGFSQGGAMALYTALRYPRPLAGVLCLSGYLPLPDSLVSEAARANASIPVFMGHGSADPIVPLAVAERTRAQLKALGYRVSWHAYPIPHTLAPKEIEDVGLWLRQVLTAPGDSGSRS